MQPRIALGAIFTESNHLVGTATTLADFDRTEFRRGGEVLGATDGVLGGALRKLRERGASIVPLMFASAVPGGPLTRDCYATLKGELIQRLRDALPVDGVLMPQHGAAAVEGSDLDGDLIAAVRAVVGPSVPVVATLDCHAHVTPSMVSNADALLAWETYPHRDTVTTGERGAAMLMDIVEKRVRPAMVMAKVPVIVGGFMGSTDDGPFAEVMRHTKSLEREPGVLSASAFLVQPQLDLPGMGGGGLVITDGNPALAEELAAGIARMYWDRRFALEPEIWKPADAIAESLLRHGSAGGLSLLLETSDCAGGGASGDSVAAIRALVEANADRLSLGMVVDPEAAAHCHRHGPGDTVSLTLGHKIDPRWGEPFPVTARVVKLSDGSFTYSGGIWGGQTVSMGPSARLRIGNVEVLVASQATYDWSDEQYRSLGMDTDAARFIVAKNPMNYRVAYGGRYRELFVLDTPGPTPASQRHVRYERLARPYFPADSDIPGLTPTILRGRT